MTTRFEVIYHADPHPSRGGKRFTVNVNGRVFLTDSQRECMTELAHFLLDECKPDVTAQIIQHNINAVKMVEDAMGLNTCSVCGVEDSRCAC